MGVRTGFHGRGRPAAATGALLVTLLAAPSAGDSPWRELEPGLELATFPLAGRPSPGSRGITVLRVDPGRWELTLHTASGIGRAAGFSARAWAEREGLVAVANAGMYDLDGRRHVGFLKDGAHVNSPRANGYLSAAAFAPRRAGDPPFRIFDLDTAVLEDLAARYDRVAQNLRLIARPGVNRWSPQEKRWREVALAEDAAGRALFVFCQQPVAMHELNERLLSLPLGVVAAQHLEGGSEAQLFVRAGGVSLELAGGFAAGGAEAVSSAVAWPLPNVIGVRRRAAPPGR